MRAELGQAVLLMAFGGPAQADEIRPFLREVLRGRPVPEEVIEESACRYEEIGGASPLLATVRRQADSLAAELARRGLPVPVYVGMCHWHPFIRDTLEEMAAAGVQRVAGIVLTPHSVGGLLVRYRGAVLAARARLGKRAPEVHFCPSWHDGSQFIDALAARTRSALAFLPEEKRSHAAWIFTAHSLPLAAPGLDIYLRDLKNTGDLLAARFGNHAWRLAFQSKSSGGHGRWLSPDINDVVRWEAERGERGMLVVPVGFACENVELLYDLDRQATRTATAAGAAFVRARAAGEHPALTAQLAEAALTVLEGK
jgi:ferrochelatase